MVIRRILRNWDILSLVGLALINCFLFRFNSKHDKEVTIIVDKLVGRTTESVHDNHSAGDLNIIHPECSKKGSDTEGS